MLLGGVTMLWNDSVKIIKGIGDKSAVLLNKLGINTVGELLMHFPRDYEEYTEIQDISSAIEGRIIIIEGTLYSRPTIRYVKNLKIVNAKLRDTSGNINITWFNMPFLIKTLKMGTYYIMRGRVVRKNGELVIEQPQILNKLEYRSRLNALLPVYSLTEGLSNNAVAKAVSYAIENVEFCKDCFNAAFRKKYDIQEIKAAVKAIHFPKDRSELEKARKRLVFNEFFSFLAALRYIKGSSVKLPVKQACRDTGECTSLVKKLPYELTGAQLRTWKDIREDMMSGYVMNRLVQGDVGSGKTILAVLSLLLNYSNGRQGAMMAPTDVLARQHYKFISKILEPFGVRVGLLTGSMTAREKREEKEKLLANTTDIIVGTHALIQDSVQYDSLGLVITDEQHRFGVNQRRALSAKGSDCHMLVMSATPIPRTLAIIIYGDMDISVIDELPANRLPIMNCVVGTSYRPSAYKFIMKEAEAGSQIYIICPMVDESESLEVENVTEYTERLCEIMPDTVRIGTLHGRMKPAAKDEIMRSFAEHEIDVLVSTTVIEVGIDVPNATVIMIENAERFGLAQLHQLRGRVGRGNKQSYCIFMSGNDSKEAMERLEVLNKSNDGFFIASEDLKMRGPGDMFGIKQSGDLVFKLSDIYRDSSILQMANEAVSEMTIDEISEIAENYPEMINISMLSADNIGL